MHAFPCAAGRGYKRTQAGCAPTTSASKFDVLLLQAYSIWMHAYGRLHDRSLIAAFISAYISMRGFLM
jgi:hypothetical protein